MLPTDWTSLESPWWAKAKHAQVHARELDAVLSDYRAQRPTWVEPVPVGDEVAHILHIEKPVPIEVSLIVGDLLHDLRSALDALVFGLVTDELGDAMTPDHEKACQFPICDTPDAFESFCGRAKLIMTPRLRRVLHGVQPFYYTELAKQMGVMEDRPYEENTWHDPLWAIGLLNNIDKHRRLAVATWWPDLAYWGSTETDDKQTWRPGDGTFEDGSTLCYAGGGGEHGPERVIYKFNVALIDRPSHNPRDILRSQDVAATDDHWITVTGNKMGQVIGEWINPTSGP